ncbi:hypothetical protein KIN20_014970 [Parelaphostrongylus tenuis]|uniref:Fork-head domain-containing protein n=1 Tax=Parelaphostrongylus tenuis TaxID=148309 RepID=A0AAD5QLX8_PARTN|nr:hypothetical protein KIN20_014970 [Parelaphostrongylus tenuis]
MDDSMMSSSHEGGLSVLLSACAPPFTLDDDFGVGWDFLSDDKDEQNDSLCSLDSLANSPASHLTAESYPPSFYSQAPLKLDCESADTSFSTFLYDQLPSPLLGMPDPTMPIIDVDEQIFSVAVTPTRRSIVALNHSMLAKNSKCFSGENHRLSSRSVLHFPLTTVRKRSHDCSMNPSSAHGRHWRQSIRHCLMSSVMFVRVLTPNPRKDYLIMNEAGSWWTVHPDCEDACSEQVFRTGAAHRCPPNGSSELFRITKHKVDGTGEMLNRDIARGKYANKKIYVRRRHQERQKRHSVPSSSTFPQLSAKHSLFESSDIVAGNLQRGDHLVVDHEEEVIDFHPAPCISN